MSSSEVTSTSNICIPFYSLEEICSLFLYYPLLLWLGKFFCFIVFIVCIRLLKYYNNKRLFNSTNCIANDEMVNNNFILNYLLQTNFFGKITVKSKLM